MGYPTKVQLIKREEGRSDQWYINFPMALARAMEFKRGETVEWFIEDRTTLVLKRMEAPVVELKKKHPRGSTTSSKRSSKSAGGRSGKKGPSKGRSA